MKLDYDADFANKLQLLDLSINSGKIQDNMTGTFDMRYRADGRIYFQQNVRDKAACRNRARKKAKQIPGNP